jgi:hypothetical protein
MANRTEDLPPVQRASKQLLGGAYSVEIGAWIWQFGATPINPTRLRHALEESSEAAPSHSSVVKELQNLEAAGLLKWMAVPGRDVYYERETSSYFEFCYQFEREMSGSHSLEINRS